MSRFRDCLHRATCPDYALNHCDGCNEWEWAFNKPTQPTADVVEVVRCKDCRCAKKMECVFISNNEQGITLHCLMHEMFVDDDDFCSWGERREDGKIDRR